MTPKETGEPTPAEWKVLKIVWDREPCPACDVVAEASEAFGWSTSTVKTLLLRLVEKGFLRTRRVGNSFLYSKASSPVRALRRAGDALLEHASDATVGPLLAHLVKRSRLSREDLEELRSLLDQKDGEEES